MPNPIVEGTFASCGDTAIAVEPTNVSINNKAVMRVDLDMVAGVKILGPGSAPYGVYINGVAVSLVGDSITGHADHAAPTFISSPDATTINIGPAV